MEQPRMGHFQEAPCRKRRCLLARTTRAHQRPQSHFKESVEFFKTFDNKLVNNPYKILFGQGDYTCSVADWTATMIEPMNMPNGQTIQPTHKTAKIEFCTVAYWKSSEIQEERLFYDVVGMMRQLGIG